MRRLCGIFGRDLEYALFSGKYVRKQNQESKWDGKRVKEWEEQAQYRL